MNKLNVLIYDTLMEKLAELEKDIIGYSLGRPSMVLDAKLCVIHQVRDIAEQAKMKMDTIPNGGAAIFTYPGCEIDAEEFNPLLKSLESNNIIGIVMSDMVDTCGYDSVDDAMLYLHAKIVSMDERRQKAEDHSNETV